METKLQEAPGDPGGSSNTLLYPELQKDHTSMAWRRAPWFYHLVSRFLAEAANTRTDLLRRLWCFSTNLLPFNQKLSTTVAVRLHSSALAGIFLVSANTNLCFLVFNILVLM